MNAARQDVLTLGAMRHSRYLPITSVALFLTIASASSLATTDGDLEAAHDLQGQQLLCSWQPATICIPDPFDPVNSVSSLTTITDAAGEWLYVGGWHRFSGCEDKWGVIRWNGTRWAPVGAAFNDRVSAVIVYDDGDGPALYAAGGFTQIGAVAANRVAKWDGVAWSPLGVGMDKFVGSLAVFDDGTGPALYAGGSFDMAGGAPASGVAKWNGVEWSSLGSGTNDSGSVRNMIVFDDGTGPSLFVGGSFLSAGSVSSTRGIARWDGIQWHSVGGGLNRAVSALALFDDGGGQALYAGGDFRIGGVAGIAKWDGNSWGMVAGGPNNVNNSLIEDLLVYDDGGGPALFVAGWFSDAGSPEADHIVKWTGMAWLPLGSGTDKRIDDLAVLDDGNGPVLITGGVFNIAGGVNADSLAKWNGSSWSAMDPIGWEVSTMATFDDGSGEALFAGGNFFVADEVLGNHVGRWNGSVWEGVGGGMNGAVKALAVADLGSGSSLFAGGAFAVAGGASADGMAVWNGVQWLPVGSGVNGEVLALAAFDEMGEPVLTVGGDFTAAGGNPASFLARWDGASWTPFASEVDGVVRAFAVMDSGNGPELYVGGDFVTAGGVTVNHVARWDGSEWHALGVGADGTVNVLAVHDDGGGPALYIGGAFAQAGGSAAAGIAKWDGVSWSELDGGVNGEVYALKVFDHGTGPALLVGGDFSEAGPIPALNVARWDGASWSAVDAGTNAAVRAFGVFDDEGLGEQLFLGGRFTEAGSSAAGLVAKASCILVEPPGPTPTSFDAVCFNGSNATAAVCGTNSDCLVGQACRLKSRFLSVDPADTAGLPVALRVHVAGVPSAPSAVSTPPYNYPAMVGDEWWVGAATTRTNDQAPYITAPLECTGTPLIQDWNAVGAIHIYGAAIVPGATYEISACSSAVGPCSAPLILGTARHGDVRTSYNVTNFADISALVSEFATPNSPVTLLKPHAWITPSNMTATMGAPFGFSQIAAGVTAFSGGPPPAPTLGANQCP